MGLIVVVESAGQGAGALRRGARGSSRSGGGGRCVRGAGLGGRPGWRGGCCGCRRHGSHRRGGGRAVAADRSEDADALCGCATHGACHHFCWRRRRGRGKSQPCGPLRCSSPPDLFGSRPFKYFACHLFSAAPILTARRRRRCHSCSSTTRAGGAAYISTYTRSRRAPLHRSPALLVVRGPLSPPPLPHPFRASRRATRSAALPACPPPPSHLARGGIPSAPRRS